VSKQSFVFLVQNTMDLTGDSWGAYGEDTEGMGFEDSHAVPGAAENSAADPAYRPWDRTIWAAVQTPSLAAAGAIHLWQGQEIFTLAGTFGLVHTVASMANLLDYGVHTGLYAVGGLDAHVYVCGLYPGTTGMGWVKWDARTDTWSSAVDAGTTAATGERMSPCVVYQRQLWHATNGVLTSFDPVSEKISQTTYTGGTIIDRLVIVDDRLFLVTAGSGTIQVQEVAGGAAVVATLGPHSINIAGGGDFAILRFPQADFGNRFYVMFYTLTGGQGSRCYKIQAGGGAPVVVTETTAMVPTSAQLILTVFENLQWPGGTAHPAYSWETSCDNVVFVPYGTAPPPDVLTKVVRGPLAVAATGFFNTVSFTFAGEGVSMPQKAAGAPLGAVETNHSYSVHSTWLGGDDRRWNVNRPKIWLHSIEAYNDGVVTRGALIKFSADLGALALSVQLYYALGDNRPQLVATLDGGTPALNTGGTSTFNSGLNRVDDIDPYDVANNRSTLIHGPVTAGPFEVGATVQGGTSLETGVIQISANGALYITGANFPPTNPFTIGETITQIDFPNAGANAVLNAQPEAIPEAVEHQVVWDLDADGIPPGNQSVTLQIACFSNAPPYDVANPPANAPSDSVYCGYLPSAWPGLISGAAPETTTAGAEVSGGVGGTTGAPPKTTAGGETVTQTSGSVPKTTAGGEVITDTGSAGATTTAGAEVFTQGAAANTTTAGGEVVTQGAVAATTTAGGEVVPDGIYPPNINARVPARAHSQPGWVNFQTDGVGVGGDHPTANLLDSASDPAEPRGSQTGAPASGDVKAVASFELGAFGIPQVGTLRSLAGIDLVAGGDTAAYTVPTGFEAVIFGASVRCESATAISAPATAQIGFNGAVDNLFSSQLLVAVTAADDAYDYPVGGESVVAPAGSVITFRVTAGATGAAQAAELILSGYLRRS
jgi:hypothetical protein